MRSDFCSFLLGFGQILVRFLVKNGQIVGQIFPNFGLIIMLTTLVALFFKYLVWVRVLTSFWVNFLISESVLAKRVGFFF